MTSYNHTPLDASLIERTRFEHDPASCITRSTVDAAAALLRQIPGYRMALGQEQTVAIPEERTGLLRSKLVRSEVRGHLTLEIRWDVSLYDAGCYASIRAFLLETGLIACVVNARDRSLMYDVELSVEDFVWMFMAAWIRKDSSATYYDAAAMNQGLGELFSRIFREHAVPGRPIADGALAKVMQTLLKAE
ncbi:MAG: hypothetical protein IJ343_14260 [Clostridia bacterium]|nr:hypothetical protein [Clostridia bacterium]